ncbi:hypothetical protein EV360DRAFT_87336 [Lentinula raphanica]|nr:hypothetical protein EV360DRAFT_87336 [Lentinula raphanica]
MLFRAFRQKRPFSFALLVFVIFELVFAVHSAAVPTEMHLAARTGVRVVIGPGKPPSRYIRVVPGSDIMGQRRSIGQYFLDIMRGSLPRAPVQINWVMDYLPPSFYVTAPDAFSLTFSVSVNDDRLKNIGTESGIITITTKEDMVRGYLRWKQDDVKSTPIKILNEEALKNLLKLYKPFLKEREDANRDNKCVISYSALKTTESSTPLRPITDRREWATCIRDVIVESVKHLGFAQDLSKDRFVPINTAYLYQLKSSAGLYYCSLPFSITLPESRAPTLEGTITIRGNPSYDKSIILMGAVEWKSKDKEPYELDTIAIRNIAGLTKMKIPLGVSYRVAYTTTAPGPGYHCFKDGWKPTTDFENSAQAAIAKALGIEPYDAVFATGAQLNVYTKGSEYSIPFATAEAQLPEKQKSGRLLFRWGQKNSDGKSGPVVEVVWDGSEGSTEVDARGCAEMWKALGLPEGHT